MAIKNNKIPITLTDFSSLNISEKNFINILEECFSRYAKAVIVDRALPDIRDGLKPVQRRIVYAMNQLHLTSNGPYKKSARIVGEVIGKYHPHGDTSVYEAIVRMSQAWKTSWPLVEMHGNNGSIDGDSAAAMRYTEIRLNKINELLTADLSAEIVDFQANFDNSETEPQFLPTLFPHLLINGASGIASGYSTDIPPHNLNEVIAAAIHLIDYPLATTDDLLKFIQGPDFPTGGNIETDTPLATMYDTGKGRLYIYARYQIEMHGKQKSIVIDQIPFNVLKVNIIKDIHQFIEKHKASIIQDVRDESGRHGIRICLDIFIHTNADKLMDALFKHTCLRVAYNYNFVAIHQNSPVLLSLRQYLKHFLTFQKFLTLTKTKFDLKIIAQKLVLNQGLIKAVSVIEQVIQLIRAATNRTDAINKLMQTLQLNEIQATAIVDLRLHRLTNTDVELLYADQKILLSQQQEYNERISDDEHIFAYIKKYLSAINLQFIQHRKTTVISVVRQIKVNQLDLVPKTLIHLVVMSSGLVQWSNNPLFVNDLNLKIHDQLITLQPTNNHHRLMIFTNQGSFGYLPINDIQNAVEKKHWYDLNNSFKFSDAEKIINTIIIDDNFRGNTYMHLVVATKNGFGKRLSLQYNDLFATRSGFLTTFIKLEADVIVDLKIVCSADHVLFCTQNNFAVQRSATAISELSYKARGQRLVDKRYGEVIAMIVIPASQKEIVLLAITIPKRTTYKVNYQVTHSAKPINFISQLPLKQKIKQVCYKHSAHVLQIDKNIFYFENNLHLTELEKYYRQTKEMFIWRNLPNYVLSQSNIQTSITNEAPPSKYIIDDNISLTAEYTLKNQDSKSEHTPTKIHFYNEDES